VRSEGRKKTSHDCCHGSSLLRTTWASHFTGPPSGSPSLSQSPPSTRWHQAHILQKKGGALGEFRLHGWERAGAARLGRWLWDEEDEPTSTVDVVDDGFKLRSHAH